MRYKVTHTTRYQYSLPVITAHNMAYLVPRAHRYQTVEEAVVRVTPAPTVQQQHKDFFGNQITLFTVAEPHSELEVTAESTVDVGRKPSTAPAMTPAWESVRDHLLQETSAEGIEAYECVFNSMYVVTSPDLGDYAAISFTPSRPILEATLDLMGRINMEFRYDQSATNVFTPLATVLHQRAGVCQDFAHLMIGCLRSMGLPARYVSGYLRTFPPPGQSRLIGADASHAWCSAFIPGIGWLDFDPTNNTVPAGSHITVAWGRDYNDVSPLRGIIVGGGASSMSVSVDVAPLDEEAYPMQMGSAANAMAATG